MNSTSPLHFDDIDDIFNSTTKKKVKKNKSFSAWLSDYRSITCIILNIRLFIYITDIIRDFIMLPSFNFTSFRRYSYYDNIFNDIYNYIKLFSSSYSIYNTISQFLFNENNSNTLFVEK